MIKSHRLMLILIKYKRVHTKEGRQPRRQMGLEMYNMCVHFCMPRAVVALICVQQTKLEYHSWELEPFGPQQCWLAVDGRVVNRFTRSQNSVTFHQHVLLRFAYPYGTPSLRPTLSWLHFCHSNDACVAWLICLCGICLFTSCLNNNLENETAPTLPNIYFICQISTPRLLKLGHWTILNVAKTAHITVEIN